jgi:hypothetical protein
MSAVWSSKEERECNGRDEGLAGLWKGRSGKRIWGEGMQVPREVEQEEEMGIGGPEVFSSLDMI